MPYEPPEYRTDGRDQYTKMYGVNNAVPSPIFCGSDTLAVIDLKVTNDYPSNGDIIQVGCIIVDDTFERWAKAPVFDLKMVRRNIDKPVSSKVLRANKITTKRLEEHDSVAALSYKEGAVAFSEWVTPFLTTPSGKLQLVVADKASTVWWLRHWLGELYPILIRDRFRDANSVLLARKDRMHMSGVWTETWWKKSSLSQVALELGAEPLVPGDAVHHAESLRRVYQAMIKYNDFI